MNKQKATNLCRNYQIITKITPKVIVDIRPGLVSPVQQAAWLRFWAKITSEAKVKINEDN
jgi:hypothetical protein